MISFSLSVTSLIFESDSSDSSVSPSSKKLLLFELLLRLCLLFNEAIFLSLGVLLLPFSSLKSS